MKMLVDWLSAERQKKRLTLTDLAQKTGLTHGTLSRIENHKTELTLFSTVRIMKALDIPWLELFRGGFVLKGLDIPDLYKEKPSMDSFPCLLSSDLSSLDLSGAIKRGVASSVVVHLLELFIRRCSPDIPKDKVSLFASSIYTFLNSQSEYPEHISQYFPKVVFRYPSDIAIQTLNEVYLSGGILILQDLSRYAKCLREERMFSLRKMAERIDITHPALHKLEKFASSKTKLDDLINLDNALQLNGQLIAFAWRTAESYLGIYRTRADKDGSIMPWTDPEIQFIEKLVIVSRLFQHYFPGDRAWLDWYRQESANGFQNIIH